MSQTKAQLIDPVDGTIVNADINASAAIAGSKISPDFGSQNIITTGSLGVGEATPSQKLQIGGDSGDACLSLLRTNAASNDNAYGHVFFENSSDVTLASISARRESATDDAYLQFSTTSTGNSLAERMRIDSSGRLLIGHTTSLAAASGGSQFSLQVLGTSFATSTLNTQRYANDVSGASILLNKSRGGIGNHTIVQSQDELGKIRFYGSDGNDFENYAAEIAALVDATPGNNAMPGRLVFKTTTLSSSVPSERVRIDSQGRLKIAGVGATISDHSATTTHTALYLQVATDVTSVATGEGGASTGLFRIMDAGSENNRYHGIEIRNKNAGDMRILNKDVGVSDQGQFVLAMPNSAGSIKTKLVIDSQNNYVALSGRDGSELLDGSATEQVDFYVATKSTITTAGDGAGTNRSGVIRIHDKGSNNSRFVGFEARNRNNGDVRFMNADLGATNKADAVVVCDNGSAIFENARFLHHGGISFNGDTAAANGLNDYEEGTFTAGINDFNGTYTARTGTYTKIGNVVTIQVMIQGNGGSGSGALKLTSLPFNSENSPTSYRAAGSVHAHQGVVTGGVQVTALMNNNDNKINIRTFQNNANTVDLNRSGLNSSGWELVIGMVYHTAA